jgi:hypothetical protein
VSRAETEEIVGWIARQPERDADVIAALTGTTEDLARERAVRRFGSEDTVSASLEAGRLRRQLRSTGALTPDEAEMLVAAEVISGYRSEAGREVEALLRDWR